MDQDTQAILKMVIIPPVGDNSLDHLNIMDLAATVCLPPEHEFLTWNHTHIAKFESFWFLWNGLDMSDHSLQHINGAVHLYFLKIRSTRYFRQQRKSLCPVGLNHPAYMMNQIKEGDTDWAPHMLARLHVAIGVLALACTGATPTFKLKTSRGTSPTTGSDIIGGAVPNMISVGGASVTGSIGSILIGNRMVATLSVLVEKATDEEKNKYPIKKKWFHLGSFGEMRDRLVNGEKVASRSVGDLIVANKPLQFPLSKADNKPLCLAWHTKVMCKTRGRALRIPTTLSTRRMSTSP